MGGFRAFIQRHPVLAFFVLVYAVSWGGLLLVIGGPRRIPIPSEETGRMFLPVYLATVAGPSLVGILMTGLVGRGQFRELFSRLTNWRVGIRWYAVALLIAPFSVVGTLLVLSLFSPEYLPAFLRSDVAASSAASLTFPVGFIVVLSLFNGFVEELGWTGFAIPRMTPRYGVLATGLSVGLLWGAWHLVSNLALPDGTGAVPLPLFMAVMLFSFLPPFRVLMVWLYARTQSLLIAMLMHASLNLFWLLSMPAGIAPVPLMVWYVAWAIVLWAFVGALAVTGRFSRGTSEARRPYEERTLASP